MLSQIFRIQEHVIPAQYIREYPGATRGNQEEELKLHIKQYIPLDQSEPLPGSVTIIGAHANAYPKELYEPLWEEIYRRSKANGFSIRSIWIADVAHEGHSSVLNENKLSNEPSWMDHPRDLLHMINHFRHEMPRPIVGIGHSMGGTQLVALALMHPRLLTTLVLLDPVISPVPPTGGSDLKDNIAYASTFRRDLWPSRDAASASFAKSPYYQRWDKRVLSRWLEFGLRDLPTAVYPEALVGSSETPVTLTTTKHQEVWTFLRPLDTEIDIKGNTTMNREFFADVDPSILERRLKFYRPEPPKIFGQLPTLRPSVLYIFGNESNMSTPESVKERVESTGIGIGGSGGAAEGRVDKIVLPGIGHLVPMEAVGDTAEGCSEWLGKELHRWESTENKLAKSRSLQGKQDDITVNAAWINNLGGPPVKKPKKIAKL